MTAYRKDFNKTKYVSFLIKDDELLEKYNEIWEKINKKERSQERFDNELVCNEKYLKAKIKSNNGKINTNLHNNKYQKKILNIFAYQ